MTAGELILIVYNFIVHPTWHLVALFVVLLLMVAWSMYKSWPGLS